LGAVQTEASRDFAFLVAIRKLREHYQRALSVLGGTDLLFPVQRFTHHASIAMISADSGDQQSAREHAGSALNVAATTTSGLRHHSGLGLVGEYFEHAKKILAAILSAHRTWKTVVFQGAFQDGDHRKLTRAQSWI
jgi:hypothetical protein